MMTALSHLASIPKRVSLPLALLILACFELIPTGLRWPARALWLLLIVSLGLSLARQAGRRRAGGKSAAKKTAFASLALCLGLLLAYLGAEAAAYLLIRSRPHLGSPPLELSAAQRESIARALADESPYTRLDPRLGWSIRPGGASADGLARSNADGFRALRSYSRGLGESRERVLTFGDSYTHCNDVADTETWQHQAELARAGLEMLNFGVGGYGVTQAYLRFETEAERFEATGAILGCMTNDLRRSLNVFYPFRFDPPSAAPSATGSPYAGLDQAGRLSFHPNPLSSEEAYRALLQDPEKKLREMERLEALFPEAGRTPLLDLIGANEKLPGHLDSAARWLKRQASLLASRTPRQPARPQKSLSIYEPGHLVFEVNLQIFERFHQESLARKLKPLILWFPSPADVERKNRGRPVPIYDAYLRALAERNIPAIDVLEWLGEEWSTAEGIDPGRVFVKGHYSPPVNAMIGRRLAAMDWRAEEQGIP